MPMTPDSRFAWMLVPLLSVFSACSTLPQYVRHTDPLTPEQHVQLGASYEAQGLTESAVEQYDAAIRLSKEYLPARIARGNLAFGSGDLKTAAACYRQVLRLDPNHAGANNNLAMVYLALGNHLDRAERYALTALEQGGPLRPYILETLAELYVREYRNEEAQKALDDSEAATPSKDEPLRQQIAVTKQLLELNRN